MDMGSYAGAIVIWVPVEFKWMYRIFPYPPPLTHVLTILMALSTGVAAFVLLRRLEGVGYAINGAAALRQSSGCTS